MSKEAPKSIEDFGFILREIRDRIDTVKATHELKKLYLDWFIESKESQILSV